MYTVLIMNQKTMDSFNQFYPLFMESMINKEIGICRWLESGTNIETAVPELYDMTDDKPSWKAIIVHGYDEDAMSKFKRSESNPFDFDIHKEPSNDLESPVPLIRLTHMLGGINSPAIQFDMQIDNSKPVKSVKYITNQNDNQISDYEILSQKYKFKGKDPAQIILLSWRNVQTNDTLAATKSWTNQMEINSSSFWKRNLYPSKCRFLTFDMQKQGDNQSIADMFNMWLSVLLISTNNVNPSFLQAYRLYRVSTDISKDNMQESFQMLINRLVSVKSFLTGINKRIIYKDNQNVSNYSTEIPLVLNIPHDKISSCSGSSFELIPDNNFKESQKWEQIQANIEDGVDQVFHSVSRSLEKTLDETRHLYHIEPTVKNELDKYQQKDLEWEVNNLYKEIMELQKTLPKTSNEASEELEDTKKTISANLLFRITHKQSFWAVIMSVIIGSIVILPAIVFHFTVGFGSLWAILLTMAAWLGVFSLTAYLVIAADKRSLNWLIVDYNQKVHNTVKDLVDASNVFSKYISSCISHSRGVSYMELSQTKTEAQLKTQKEKQNHIKSIDLMVSKIEAWSKAYFVEIDFNANDFDEYPYLDLETPPYLNLLYTFDSEDDYKAVLNISGEKIKSPFDFVERLIIEREVLFDDDKSN